MIAIPIMATCVPKMSGMGGCYCGRRGLPAEAVATMYADYLRLGSLSKVGKLHGRRRQALFDIFKRRGLKLNSRNFKPQIKYRGRKYTLSKDDYYRDTIFRSGKYTEETFLHRRIWADANGKIPDGFTICFRDGDRANCVLENLVKLSHEDQQQLRGSKGQNQFTKDAPEMLRTLLSGRGGELLNLRRAR